MTETVQPGRHITMHIRITLDNGIVAEDSFDDEPLRFVVGDGSVLPNLEQALIGLPRNEPTRILISADEGFGARDPGNIHTMQRADFPPNVDVAPGRVIGFNTPSGEEVAGTIIEVGTDRVDVDFNHPLAGHNLTVDVEILDIGDIPTGLSPMQILLANPRGFCAGVDRAIGIVERALQTYGAPVYVRHEVVHNRYVVDDLRSRGAVFVDELDEVPDDGLVIFSAHGVAKSVTDEAERRGLRVFDATCPLVTKVHLEVGRQGRDDREVVLIGHAGHPEVEGTMGRYGSDEGIYLVETPDDVATLKVIDPERLAYVTQTTLSMDDTSKVVDALRNRFPAIQGPKKDDICYATQNRQDAVKDLADHCDVILVVGSPNSSNSNRLRELAEKRQVPAYLIDGPEDIDRKWLTGKERIGITAGASAPEILVNRVVAQLQEWGAVRAEEAEGIKESVVFPLPKELR